MPGHDDTTVDPPLAVLLAGMERDAAAHAAESRLVLWQAAAVLGWLALAVAVVAFLAVGF